MNMQKLQSFLLTFLMFGLLPAQAYAEGALRNQGGILLSAPNPLAASLQAAKTPTSQTGVENIRLENYDVDYQVNADYTYTEVISEHVTLLTAQGIEEWQRASQDFYPDSQALKLVEAYVIQPNGKKIPAAPDNIFTRPSQESQDAPGFTNSMTTTVVFPQLTIGSQIFVKWKLIQKKPSLVGFSGWDIPLFDEPTVKSRVKITMPATLKLQWKKRGDYVVTDEIQGAKRIVTAVIQNHPARQPEAGMVDVLDFTPLFAFSSLERWEDLGAIYWKQSHDKAIVTPEIRQLANKITGNKQGLEAARAIYNWVAQNIHYVAVYLNEDAGYVPHTATEILRNGYGDCKDHVAIMQALLQAKGITSYPVLIDWGRSFTKFPLAAPQFNHAIIYLPDYKIFANPTDQYAAFGKLDTSLSGKFVVIATPHGSTAYTPQEVPEQNRYSMASQIAIAADGTITGVSDLKFAGNFNGDIRQLPLNRLTQFATAILAATPEGGTGNLTTSDLSNLDLPVTLRGTWSSPYAVNMGQQVYLTTPIGIDTKPAKNLRAYITPGKRQYPLVTGAKQLNWDYKITLPVGYKISRLPENIQFSNAAGEYASRYQVEAGMIHVQRSLTLKQSVFQAEEYSLLEALVYKPINDSRSVITLEKR